MKTELRMVMRVNQTAHAEDSSLFEEGIELLGMCIGDDDRRSKK